MKKHISLAGATLALAFVSAAPLDSAPAELVKIETRFPGDEEASRPSLGFVLEETGFLLTTYQSLLDPEGAELSHDISVRSGDGGMELTGGARVIGVEPTLNLAILKIAAEASPRPARVSTARDQEPGDPITAYASDEMGALAPVVGTFTEMNTLECYQQNLTGTMLKGALQMPASGIGSPVFNASGEVFAIHTAYRPAADDENDPENTDLYLLPMSLALNVYEGIKQRGNLLSPWTGFSVRALTEEESAQFPAYGGRIKGAVALEHVWEGGPAEALGLRSGDLLVKFGHYPIRSVGDFQKWLYMYGVGHSVKLHFLRGGELVAFPYTIDERPDWATPQ